MKNIAYKTDHLANNFSQDRITWEQFYESECKIIEKLNFDSSTNVLDIGCGCGGLGLALKEKFGVENYTGVEINALAAKVGQEMNPMGNIISGDILDVKQKILKNDVFDAVFSLSCIDWNVQFSDMLGTAWECVKPGGYFVATFRLTVEVGCNDINKSYQYINYVGQKEGEVATYVVLNANNLLQQLNIFNPSKIIAYGYFGKPSATAVTPYTEICFSAFAIQKRMLGDNRTAELNFNLPKGIRSSLESGQQ